MITFTVMGSAEPAGSKKAYKRGMHISVVDANPRARGWKDRVAQVAGESYTGPLLEGPLVLELTFYRPRPLSHIGAKGVRSSAPQFPTTRPDATKLVRGVEDALTGVLWRDDAQIIAQYAFKLYGEPARCAVKVWEASESPWLTALGSWGVRVA